jgi:predicted PurR-regulated permease PerM
MPHPEIIKPILKSNYMLDKNNGKTNFLETALVLMLLVVLIYASYTTLSAFLGIFTFATIFSVSFFNLFEKMCGWFGGKRKIAAFVYGLLMVAIIALPFIYIISALVDYAHKAQSLIADIKNNQVPALPEWISGIPYIGNKATAFWSALEKDPASTISAYETQLKSFLQHIMSAGGGIVSTGLELVVAIIISAIVLANGEKTLEPLKLFFNRLLGVTNGTAVINASGRAIKGVAIGVMGTAFIEALFSWIGYSIAGIDAAVGLAAITFFLAVIQLGPLLVLIPVIIWLSSQGQSGWAIFLSVYGLVVLVGIDNVLKPILIGKSGKLPILVLFLGVVGGMGAWGFTGMFKGAIILAVAYTIFQLWAKNTAQNNKDTKIVTDQIGE